MAEILPGVFQVEGIDPPGFTTHVYVLKDQRGPNYTIIDTGVPGSDAGIETYLRSEGIEIEQVRKILITHLHADHTGALRGLVRRTHARTFAHWVEASYIAREPAYDGPGMPPSESARIDEPLADGAHIDGGGGLIAYHTPGHTPGHTVYYQPERKLLFTGDLFSIGADGALALAPDAYSLHPPTVRLSARRVAQLSIEALLTYHGGPMLERPAPALRALLAPRA